MKKTLHEMVVENVSAFIYITAGAIGAWAAFGREGSGGNLVVFVAVVAITITATAVGEHYLTMK